MYEINFPGKTVNFCLKHVVRVNFGYLGVIRVHPLHAFRDLSDFLLHGGLEVAPPLETLSQPNFRRRGPIRWTHHNISFRSRVTAVEALATVFVSKIFLISLTALARFALGLDKMQVF